MPFKKRRIESLTTSATTVMGTVGLGATTSGSLSSSPYGKVHGFTAKLWATATKAGPGLDTSGIIELKDADGRIFYLDSAARDYGTAALGRTHAIVYDDLLTGLDATFFTVTSDGVAVTAAQPVAPPVVRGPITVTARSFGTVTEFLTVDLLVEV